MARLRTTPAKALAQIERRDAEGAKQYRAELRYFHVPQRYALGMTTAYAIHDEIRNFVSADAKLNALFRGWPRTT